MAHVLNELAWNENRWPKQQAEWLLQKALEQAQREEQARAAEENAHEAALA